VLNRAIGSVQMRPGDVFVVDTPGGGGWGDAADRQRRLPGEAQSPVAR